MTQVLTAEQVKQMTPAEINEALRNAMEYDYCYIKPFDCVDISTEKDSFYCYPEKQNVITKLAFATEEIYKRKQRHKTAVQ